MSAHTERQGWYGVALLLLAYTASFVDRIIISLLVVPIQRDLQINDTELSLLYGIAFALFYTALGVPIARIADRTSRKRLIIAGIVVWSLATAACGLARNFAQLFIARISVGVGEAALSPAAYSMIYDWFPRDRLASAHSVYSSGIAIGSGLALIIGGTVIVLTTSIALIDLPGMGTVRSWHLAFFVVGLPGLLIALLMCTLREPKRREGTVASVPTGAAIPCIRAQPGAFVTHFAGFSLASLVFNGFLAWAPTLLIRRFGVEAGVAGPALGTAMLVFGTCGMLAGGWLADRLTRSKGVDGSMRAAMIACIGLVPAAIVAPLLQDFTLTIAAFCLFFFFASMPFGIAPAALQMITPAPVRAQMAALYLLAINIAGIGAGATTVALLTDYVFASKAAVGLSMAIIGGIAAPLAALCLAVGLRAFRAAAAELTVEG